MPRHRPPPLQLLPAFEAASRLLSFSQAAQELHVSPAAISQQIRQLEQWLETPLFNRLVRQVTLTPAGEQFAQVASDTLRRYREGHAKLVRSLEHPRLRLSTAPIVAHELLIPALGEFRLAHPHIDLQLDIRLELVNLEQGEVDAAIRFGLGDWPGLTSRPLRDCAVTLAAAPALLARHPVRTLDDLAEHTLIHFRREQDDWALVAQALGIERVPHRDTLTLDSELAALRAAEQGLGVMICVLPACQGWLDKGLLTPLFPAVPIEAGYHFVFKPQPTPQPTLEVAYPWLRERMRAWG